MMDPTITGSSNEGGNNNFTYQPTPIEIEYAQYLIRTVFPQCMSSNSTATTTSSLSSTLLTSMQHTELHISGKYIVPFLQCSNIDRAILRTIWNLVDTKMIGSITSVQQFTTLLRYISILQNNHDTTTTATTAAAVPINSSAESLQQLFLQSIHLTNIPFAQFAGYPIPPHLLQVQHHRQQHPDQQQQPANANAENDPFRAFDTIITENPTPTIPVTTATTKESNGEDKTFAKMHNNEMTTTPTTTTTTSTSTSVSSIEYNIMDVAPGYGTTVIPSLLPTSTTTTTKSQVTSNDWDAFDAITAPTTTTTTTTTTSILTNNISSSSSSNNNNNQTCPINHLPIQQPVSEITASSVMEEETESEGFGDFVTISSAAAAAASNDDQNIYNNHEDHHNHINLHPTGSNNIDEQLQQHKEELLPPPIEAVPSLLSSTNQWDAFDAILETNRHNHSDIPLEPLPSSFVDKSKNISSNDYRIPSQPFHSTIDDHEEFDDFVTSSTNAAMTEQHVSDVTTTSTEISGWDALDALASTIPTPTFSLESGLSTTSSALGNDKNTVTEPPAAAHQQHLDDIPYISGWDALDALASTIPAPALSSLTDMKDTFSATTATTPFESSSLQINEGNFIGATKEGFVTSVRNNFASTTEVSDTFTNIATPIIEIARDSTGIEKEGLYENSNNIKNINDTTIPQARPLEDLIEHTNGTVGTHNNESGWDALNSIVETCDAPLPSLKGLSYHSNNKPVDSIPIPLEEDFSDGFGDFIDGTYESGVPITEKTGVQEKVPSNMHTQNDPTSDDIDNSIPSAGMNRNVSTKNYESGWGALDAFAEATDTPLPILEVLSNGSSVPTTSQHISDEQDLSYGLVSDGDEHRIPKPTNEIISSETIPDHTLADKSPQFFDITIGNGTTLPNAVTLDNTIGGESGTAGMNLSESNRDTSDSIIETTDAPLPSLGQSSSESTQLATAQPTSAEEDISDGFGDFIGNTDESPMQTQSSNLVYVDPFSEMNSSGQRPVPSSNILYDRADSTYYSAQAVSVTSDSQDWNNFEDATMNGSEIDDKDIIQIDATNIDLQHDESNDFPSSDVVDMYDPIATFNAVLTTQADTFTDPQTYGVIQDDNVDTTILTQNDTVKFNVEFSPTLPNDVVGDDDFGDFETVQVPETRNADEDAIRDTRFGNFDDFGNFETASSTETVEPVLPPEANGVVSGSREIKHDFVIKTNDDWTWTQEQIALKSHELPDIIRRTFNGFIDIGSCFYTNIGRKVPLSDSRMHQVLRCFILIDRFSSSHGKKLSIYWVQVLSIIKHELLTAITILEDSVKLEATDLKHLKGNIKIYLLGIKEFVRVSRFISATIADLLMLDVFTMLSTETLSASFLSSTLATDVHDIEQLWNQIQTYDETLNLGGVVTDNASLNRLEDIVEIRSRLFDSSVNAPLCDFTLQPLPNPVKIKSTQNVLSILGYNYMACAANLLSHKTTFFSESSNRRMEI